MCLRCVEAAVEVAYNVRRGSVWSCCVGGVTVHWPYIHMCTAPCVHHVHVSAWSDLPLLLAQLHVCPLRVCGGVCCCACRCVGALRFAPPTASAICCLRKPTGTSQSHRDHQRWHARALNTGGPKYVPPPPARPRRPRFPVRGHACMHGHTLTHAWILCWPGPHMQAALPKGLSMPCRRVRDWCSTARPH